MARAPWTWQQMLPHGTRTLGNQERGSWQELCAPASKCFHAGCSPLGGRRSITRPGFKQPNVMSLVRNGHTAASRRPTPLLAPHQRAGVATATPHPPPPDPAPRATPARWGRNGHTTLCLGENNPPLFLGENNPTFFARTLDDQERGSWQELRRPGSKCCHTGRARWATRGAVVGRSSADLLAKTPTRDAHAG